VSDSELGAMLGLRVVSWIDMGVLTMLHKLRGVVVVVYTRKDAAYKLRAGTA